MQGTMTAETDSSSSQELASVAVVMAACMLDALAACQGRTVLVSTADAVEASTNSQFCGSSTGITRYHGTFTVLARWAVLLSVALNSPINEEKKNDDACKMQRACRHGGKGGKVIGNFLI